MGKFIMVLSIIAFIAVLAWNKPAAREEVKWMSLEEAEENSKKLEKPILIDLYTDWCGWCKVMDKQTYANKEVAAYIMDKFYPVKLNAEQKQAIVFGGKTYQYNEAYRTHDFAIYLTQGQLSYPTTVIIPTKGNPPQAIPGFLKPAQIEPIVKYFGEKQFGRISFTEFQKSMKANWK